LLSGCRDVARTATKGALREEGNGALIVILYIFGILAGVLVGMVILRMVLAFIKWAINKLIFYIHSFKEK
jgi:hypothetical protein